MIDTATIRRIFLMVSTLSGIVLVPLFVQKSDGNSTVEVIGLIAISYLGVLSCAWALIVGVTRRDNHWYRASRTLTSAPVTVLAAVLGILFITFSLVRIDREDNDFEQSAAPPARCTGFTDSVLAGWTTEPTDDPCGGPILNEDSDEVALRNLVFATTADGARTRIVVTIVNKLQSTLVLDAVRINVSDPSAQDYCASADGGRYRIEGLASGNVDATDQPVAGDAGVSGGPLDGTTVPVSGRLELSTCYDVKNLDLYSTASIAVAPLESSTLAFEFPAEMTLTEIPKRSSRTATPAAPRLRRVPLPDADDRRVAVGVSYGGTAIRAGTTSS